MSSRPESKETPTPFEVLMDRAPIGLFLFDGALRFRHVNPKAAPAFGDVGNPVGRSFEETMRVRWLAELVDDLRRIYRHALESGEPFYQKDFANATMAGRRSTTTGDPSHCRRMASRAWSVLIETTSPAPFATTIKSARDR